MRSQGQAVLGLASARNLQKTAGDGSIQWVFLQMGDHQKTIGFNTKCDLKNGLMSWMKNGGTPISENLHISKYLWNN
jgi:hypothetical protein